MCAEGDKFERLQPLVTTLIWFDIFCSSVTFLVTRDYMCDLSQFRTGTFVTYRAFFGTNVALPENVGPNRIALPLASAPLIRSKARE